MIRSWQDIPFIDYLNSALKLSVSENLLLDNILKKLPNEIIDTHTHIARSDDVDSLSPELLKHIVSTYPVYSLEDAIRVREQLWIGKKVRSLRMAHAVAGYKHENINDYLHTAVGASDDVFVGYGVPDKLTYTCQLIETGEIYALKMYFKYKEPYAKSIFDVFPIPILECAQSHNVPIILHLPQSLPRSLDQVIGLLRSFPRLIVILAHLGGHGGQRYKPDIVPAYEYLAKYPQLYMDTALVYDSNVIAAAVATFGFERLLFGTDEPLSLIRGVNYLHPLLGHRLYAPQYHWAQDDFPPPEVSQASPTLLHIQQIQAILSALQTYKSEAVDALFCSNAKTLFKLSDL